MDELTAVKLAIRMEEKAALFYSEAARQTNDPQAKKILGKFSEDEEKHGQFLQTLVDSYYIKNGSFDPPDLTATEYPVNKDGPIYGKSMKELSSHPEPVAAAVEKFALAEGEALHRGDRSIERRIRLVLRPTRRAARTDPKARIPHPQA